MGDDDAPVDSSVRSVRRTPVQMDELRARMIREGYALAGLSGKEQQRVWVSLTQKRRWPELQRLTGMEDAQLSERIRAIRKEYQAATGKR